MEIIDFRNAQIMEVGQEEILPILNYLQRSTNSFSVEERYIVVSELLKAIQSSDLLETVLKFLFSNKMLTETSISRKIKADFANFSLLHNTAAFSVLSLYEYFFKMSAWLEEATKSKGGNATTASFPSLQIRADKNSFSHNLDEVREYFRRKMTIYAANFDNEKSLPERERHLKKLIGFLAELAYEDNTTFYDRDLDYLRNKLASLTEDNDAVQKKSAVHIFYGIGEEVFGRIASQIEKSEANLSQIYRRMFEDKLIHCKAEKFRDWVNETFDLEIGKIRVKKSKPSELDQLYLTVYELSKRRKYL